MAAAAGAGAGNEAINYRTLNYQNPDLWKDPWPANNSQAPIIKRTGNSSKSALPLLHKRRVSCTDNFGQLAERITAHLQDTSVGSNNETRYSNALEQIRKCFDDRFWFQRYPNYCGKWTDNSHFFQTRKILQLYYTLGRLSKGNLPDPAAVEKKKRGKTTIPKLEIEAKDIKVTHYDVAPYGNFAITNEKEPRELFRVDENGFLEKAALGSRTEVPAVKNAIDPNKEYEPFGKLNALPFIDGGSSACINPINREWPRYKVITFNKDMPLSKLHNPTYPGRASAPPAAAAEEAARREAEERERREAARREAARREAEERERREAARRAAEEVARREAARAPPPPDGKKKPWTAEGSKHAAEFIPGKRGGKRNATRKLRNTRKSRKAKTRSRK